MKNKRLKTILVFIFIYLMKSYAQETEKPVALKKHSFTFDAYYGFPDLDGLTMKNYGRSHTSARSSQYSNYGGIYGARVEFFIGNRIAVGVDANYSFSKLKWEREIFEQDSTTQQVTQKWYNYETTHSRLRIIGKFNYHILVTQHVDFYTGGGIGFNNFVKDTKSDNPNMTLSKSFFIPIEPRADIGVRYYFFKNLGLGFEFGIGGPLCSISICSKF